MSGVKNLKRMEASDMIDVFHVLFEEDSIPRYEEHQQVKSRVRETLYSDLYGRPYKFAYKQASTEQEALGFDPSMELPQNSEKPREIKPYIPPTNPEDLPAILDRPLG